MKENGLDKYYDFISEDKNTEIISPHAMPLILKKEYKNRYTTSGWQKTRYLLYTYLELNGIQTKTLFGSLPTQHNAFDFLGYKLGDFPVAEYVGNTGCHVGCHQYMSQDDLLYIVEKLTKFFNAEAPIR